MKLSLTTALLVLSFVVSASATANDQSSTAKTVSKWSLAGLGGALCMSGLTILESKPVANAASKAVKGPLFQAGATDALGNLKNMHIDPLRDGKFGFAADDYGAPYEILTRDQLIEKVGLKAVEGAENIAKYNGFVSRYSLILLAADAGICSGVIGEALRNHGSITQNRTVNVVGDSEPKSQLVKSSNAAN